MRIRIHKRIVFPMETLMFFGALFFVSSYALLENVSISIPMFSYIKMPLLYAGGMCIVFYVPPLFRALKKKKYFYVMMCLAVFCLLLEITALANREVHIGSNPQRGTIRLILYLVELFLLMIWTAERGRSQRVLNFLFIYVLLLTTITDLFIIWDREAFGVSAAGIYLIGSKFTVAYFHINLFVLWFCRNRDRFFYDRRSKRIIYVGLPIILYISIYVDCMTGVLGCFTLLVLFLLMNTSKVKKLMKLTSPVYLLITLVMCFSFPFLCNNIMTVPFVRNMLEMVFNRSTTLSGRLDIYQQFLSVMDGHWLWGYGFGNANAVSMIRFGYANSQNAILQWILQTGLPTTVMLIVLMVVTVYCVNRSNATMQSMPLLMLMYVYILIGMVEITFSMSFLLWLALIFMYSGCSTQITKGIDNSSIL